MTTAQDVKGALVSVLGPSLRAAGFSSAGVDDDLDLRKAGLVDSLGFMRLLTELERQIGRSIDLSGLAPDLLTRVGPLTRHIAEQRS